MNKQLEILQGLVEKLSTRERVLVLLGVLAVIYMLWNTLLIEPMQMANNSLLGEREKIQEQLSNLERRRILASGQLNKSKREQIRHEMQVVEEKINVFDKRIIERLQGQVDPENMAGMLNDVLQNNHNLKLLSIQNEPARPFINSSGTAQNNTAKSSSQLTSAEQLNKHSIGIFLHALEIELQGRYLDILDYLQALEALQWKIFWDQVKIDSMEYPVIKVKIRVHTFSLKDGWLSV